MIHHLTLYQFFYHLLHGDVGEYLENKHWTNSQPQSHKICEQNQVVNWRIHFVQLKAIKCKDVVTSRRKQKNKQQLNSMEKMREETWCQRYLCDV